MCFKRDSRGLVETALGNSPADTVIRDGVLNVLTTAAIPFIRMTEKGYYRFREKDVVTLNSV